MGAYVRIFHMLPEQTVPWFPVKCNCPSTASMSNSFDHTTIKRLVRVFSGVLVAFLCGKYQDMEKPLKHQRRLGLYKGMILGAYSATRIHSPWVPLFSFLSLDTSSISADHYARECK